MSSYSFASEADMNAQKALDAKGEGIMGFNFNPQDLDFSWDDGGISAPSGYEPSGGGGGLFDGIGGSLIGTARDLFGDYLQIKSQEKLIDVRTKLILAEREQSALLNAVDVPSNVNAQTLEPWQLAALANGNSGGGIDNKTLLIAAAVFAAVMLLK